MIFDGKKNSDITVLQLKLEIVKRRGIKNNEVIFINLNLNTKKEQNKFNCFALF